MNTPSIQRKLRPLAAAGMLVALAIVVANGFGLSRARAVTSRSESTFNTLVRWKDASHDWLLVADDKANQLTVYDANDGRLLHTLDRTTGFGEVAALAQRDGQLFVVEDSGRLDPIQLPQLQLIASSDR
ncbi:hypothetical protein [Rhodanobacter sp. L36]|uniref:hypothetical protein n=1 Tax=Rhodanobacter sp. L36 TaxID=1747221 RepID=UPI00131B109E|nr:hypothetical protein [Rhodanobacter sp. L36]